MLIQFLIKIFKKYLLKEMSPDTPISGLSFRCKVPVLLCAVLLSVSGMTYPDYAQAQVDLYGVFETQVTNSKTYPNPFDFNIIELQATFTSPSGNAKTVFGFYDGDGVGGQTGNIWKLRFMPDEVGTWTYTYSWTDGIPGGSGSFNVVDSGLGGPLKIAADNSWYFENARGNPFHWRGYDIRALDFDAGKNHLGFRGNAADDYIEVLQTHVLPRNYNFLMLEHPCHHIPPAVVDPGSSGSWWFNGKKDVFDVLVLKNFEKILKYALDKGIYVMPFCGMVSQASSGHMSNVLIRYFAARLGPFANYLGYSITWEYYDVFSEAQINSWMTFLKNSLPSGGTSLLTVHDKAKVGFTSWQDFHMQQGGNNGVTSSIFSANRRSIDVDSALRPYNKPIIGSEDIWEAPSGSFGYARNATEVRRTAWGEMMAGVMPLYSEWTWFIWNDEPAKLGNGEGEPEVRRMFDFFYSKTRYRQYQQLNSLVSSTARQIASGIPGQEYLVYDEDGGSIAIDLSGASVSSGFNVLWFDPKSGVEQNGGSLTGGEVRSIASPFSGDSVLLLTGLAVDATAPSAPPALSANAMGTSQFSLSWQVASDPESGVASYKVYRNGLFLNNAFGTTYSDTGLSEGTQYTYEVSAVNGAGMEGPKSASVSVTTPADTTPPGLVSVSVGSDPTKVTVVFSEPVEAASATAAANYAIDNGITVLAAALGTDLKTVTLTTSAQTEGVAYQLTVNNVRDRAATPNVIAPNSTATYTFAVQLPLSNLTVGSGLAYEVVQNGLVDGAAVYIDRTYNYSGVPPALSGATYIKTANGDKASVGSPFLAFDINQAATVYVAHDDRISPKPLWLSSFADTGQDVTISGQLHSFWKKDFSSGSVVLGGNEGGSGSSMYTVMVFQQGGVPVDAIPPSVPTGLTAD